MFGPAVIVTQPYFTVFAEHEVNQKDDETSYCPHINPVEVDKNEILNEVQNFISHLRIENGYKRKGTRILGIP